MTQPTREELQARLDTLVAVNQQEQAPGVWTSAKRIIHSIAEAAEQTTDMIGTTAKMGNTLAGTGLHMAEANDRFMQLKTTAEEQRRMAELKALYPDLELLEAK